jgi:hypothetical protein
MNESKLIRVSEKVFKKLIVFSSRLQLREKRVVSLSEALEKLIENSGKRQTKSRIMRKILKKRKAKKRF